MKEENLPIDIYYNKLLDWLIDRRHCNAKWQAKISDIRQKINIAIQDMPENKEIAELLTGAYINYFHCKEIVQLLKKCGEGSTNFFGQYSSKRMKDWQEILSVYQEENSYLAEAAHLLIRNVNYEIPGLKKQIQKCQQIQRECARKENDCSTNAVKYKEKYLQTCKQIGITGDDVRKELMKLVDELPNIFTNISEKTKSVKEAIEFYETFVKFVSSNDSVEICNMIKFVIENGNATVYQWKNGEPPSKIVEEIKTIDLDAMAQISSDSIAVEENEEIDWGTEDGGIDYDIDVAAVDSNEIDFVDNDNIDWGDVTNDLSNNITIEEVGIENPDGGVASGTEALSVLDNHATRNVFTDELVELVSFLEQRIVEVNIDADMITINQFQSAPPLLQHQSKDHLKEMLSQVHVILNEITSKKMQNLYLIRSSARYVDRIAESLQQKLKISKNLVRQIDILQAKSKDTLQMQGSLEPKLDIIVRKTKELQKQLQGEISKRYKDRLVNIMGEINMI